MRHTKKLITLAGIAAFVTYWFYLPTYPVYPKSDHYDPDTQTFYNAEPQRAPINVASALWDMTFYEKVWTFDATYAYWQSNHHYRSTFWK